MKVPITVRCECGHTSEATAGEEVVCVCGRRYATELSQQQMAALRGLQAQMKVFARLGVGVSGLLAIAAFTFVNIFAGMAALALAFVGWWVILQPAWRRRAVLRVAAMPPATVRPL
jgi:hypothetical protein